MPAARGVANTTGNPAINKGRPTPIRSAGRTEAGYANGSNRLPAAQNNGNGRVMATPAQQRAIFAICKAQGLDMAGVLTDFNVADPKDLPIKDARRLIDQLKAQNGNGAAAQ